MNINLETVRLLRDKNLEEKVGKMYYGGCLMGCASILEDIIGRMEADQGIELDFLRDQYKILKLIQEEKRSEFRRGQRKILMMMQEEVK